MSKNKTQIIDDSPVAKTNYMETVFFRGNLKNEITRLQWLKLTFFEILVGIELIESFVITSSYQQKTSRAIKVDGEHGAELHLNTHIPSGFINDRLRPILVEVLYYKFYKKYYLIEPESNAALIPDNKGNYNLTRIRFCIKKKLFHQLIAFRRVYDLSWLIFNGLCDTFVFFYTNSIELALFSAIAIEGIRRLIKL